MSLVSSSAVSTVATISTNSACFPSRNAGSYYHHPNQHCDEDRSVVSRGSTSASSPLSSPLSSSSTNQDQHYDCDYNCDYILCASPSSSSMGRRTTTKAAKILQMNKSRFHTEELYHRGSHNPSMAKAQAQCAQQHTTALQHCFENADFMDRIGQTLSFLFLSRLAFSFLLATILDED